jgi:hypothetical protein
VGEGFVVQRAETEAFVARAVRSLGVNDEEAFEFVVVGAPNAVKFPT